MKKIIIKLIQKSLQKLPDLSEAATKISIETTVERSRNNQHGDFACNIAMQLAGSVHKKPREIAVDIIKAIDKNNKILKIEIAGPGFINFYLSPQAFHEEFDNILKYGKLYGRQSKRNSPKILLEFISANPTGPLHVGHGRHAAYGASVGNLLEAAGYEVYREYYVNDAGRQIDILGTSVWIRWLQSIELEIPFPTGGYHGKYINNIANEIGTAVFVTPKLKDILDGLPKDMPEGNADIYIDALTVNAKKILGDANFDQICCHALNSIQNEIKDDLKEFGVLFDNWYSERSLADTGRIDTALEMLRKKGMLYKKDGATWFSATQYGDDKDRVVIRANGMKTYFASDIAYHFDKRSRGFDHLLNILGSDHHGYISRLQAGLEAIGHQGSDLEVELVQFVSLYRNGEKMQMSTRSGQFDTLRQLRAEVGNDAARFYYVMRSNDQHLDFDLDVAKMQSNDNPVFYIQYAHARISRVFKKAEELKMNWHVDQKKRGLSTLVNEHEKLLMSALCQFPEIIELAAKNRAPQILVRYLLDLVGYFHSNYNANKVLVDDEELRNARLTLYAAIKCVIANGLDILGVSAPEKM
ncbi:MAG: arginine--tRNA ligase [Gammaproteobacteria bacterium]|nr:arginine--tRNA ligase [Gammaproteobacteria bacterium]|tara:strand:+ start:32146 stop:33897 length:1752 start_codon:yes stop_codon:yes gene_type:complete